MVDIIMKYIELESKGNFMFEIYEIFGDLCAFIVARATLCFLHRPHRKSTENENSNSNLPLDRKS